MVIQVKQLTRNSSIIQRHLSPVKINFYNKQAGSAYNLGKYFFFPRGIEQIDKLSLWIASIVCWSNLYVCLIVLRLRHRTEI